MTRSCLSRFWSLHHIGVFPSIYPEAFGIAAAEIMASGLLLCSSGVGGASEMFESYYSGCPFLPNDSNSLTAVISNMVNNPYDMSKVACTASSMAKESLDVMQSAIQLNEIFLKFNCHS